MCVSAHRNIGGFHRRRNFSGSLLRVLPRHHAIWRDKTGQREIDLCYTDLTSRAVCGGLFDNMENLRMRERDTQRARVYKSDHALGALAKPLPTVRGVERYVKRLFEMKRVQGAFPRLRPDWLPTVGDGRGRRMACGWSGGIKIPLWARNEMVVIHELAHTVTHRQYGSGVAAHGWQFCSVYLTLTLHAMGREAHDTLKVAFKRNRVRYTAPRKRRELSDAERQALADRLTLGRLAAASARRAEAA